jgi:hypothetical protein
MSSAHNREKFVSKQIGTAPALLQGKTFDMRTDRAEWIQEDPAMSYPVDPVYGKFLFKLALINL